MSGLQAFCILAGGIFSIGAVVMLAFLWDEIDDANDKLDRLLKEKEDK